ncbi:hypothetical protein [Flaviaesturariibacter amylovorans]|uniref:DUF3999 family protein n=1 Tax=Flaviaesturariibacter amylovorans TaxID=1084520 RepID=A0ABP8G4E9_9BACT
MTVLYKGLLALALGAGSVATAQPRVQARLEAVPRSGWYRLALTTAFTAHCRPDLSDLRLRDDRGNTVAYLLDSAAAVSGYSYVRCPLLAMRTDSVHSFIELEVPPPGTGTLLVQFANTSARRTAHLSGSHDRRQWYSIAEHLELSPTAVSEAITQQSFTFPFSRYPYLRLQVRNNGMDPMEILEAGYSTGRAAPAPMEPLGALSLRRHDSAGHTRLHLRNGNGNLLERIRITVEGAPYFLRNSTLYAVRGGREVYVTNFLLSPGQTELLFATLNDTTLVLVIENGDNPPLRISGADAFQRSRSLRAWLEGGMQYTLQAGDPEARAPRYDLSAFRDTLPQAVATLAYGAPEPLGQVASPKAADQGIRWIWVAVVAGAAVLLLLTAGLLRDMKKKRDG